MQKMTDQEILAVVRAKIDGEQIQYKWPHEDDSAWRDDGDPQWDFVEKVFRVKPKPLVTWCNMYKYENGVIEAYGYDTREKAERAANSGHYRVAVRMVEQSE